MQAAELHKQPDATTSRQQAAELRMGAHLALALCYLPVGLPQPQDQLHVRSGEAAEEEPDPEALGLSTAEDLALQVSIPAFLPVCLYVWLSVCQPDYQSTYLPQLPTCVPICFLSRMCLPSAAVLQDADGGLDQANGSA